MKTKHYATVVCLAGFLLVFGLWSLLRPADAISVSERRPLAQAPALSFQTIRDGTFMDKAESYAVDQFPLRESFRTLKALVSYDLLRQKDHHGVYLSDGYAAQMDYPMNTASLDHAAERFAEVCKTYLQGSKVYLSVVPDKNYFMAKENGVPALDYKAFVAYLREKTPQMTYVDLFDTLRLSDYYRTDSHWRQEALQPVAQKITAAMGATTGTYTERMLDRPFYGVYYGYAALPMQPDTLRYLMSDTLAGCTVWNYETNSAGDVYDLAAAQGDDPYALFLSGSVSLLRIDNPNAATDRELIVFRDSFGSSLAPLLVESYASVTLVDIRYLPTARLGRFIDFHGQDVLFLYSTSVLNNSETLQ